LENQMPRTQINCPQCQQPIIADVQQLFDVGLNPQDKQIFLAGAHNLAQCPHCGYQGMLASPLVYHDPEKELLLTFFPPEMGLPMQEQERMMGPLIKQVVDSLPQEKRKGYLFNPKAMLTMQGMLETVLEADGITKEMIQAQQDRMRLIERLLSASEDSRIDTIQKEDEQIDADFFVLLSNLMQTAVYGQDESSARQLSDLQKLLLEHSTKGRELKVEADEVQAAMKSLQDLGENITRDDLVDLVVAAPTDTRLHALVQFVRPGMDYEFFTKVSAQIDQAEGKQKEELSQMRDKLLEFTREYDEELAARAQAARQNLETLLQAPNLEEAVMQNLRAIDEVFMQTLTNEIDTSRKEGNLDRSARLQQIVSIIEEASAPPPELGVIEELMEVVDDEAALEQMLEDRADDITPEVAQTLTSLIAQGQSVVQEAQGEAQNEQREALDRIQIVYEAVLRFSMRRSFKGQ
jgi:hypothetical protein